MTKVLNLRMVSGGELRCYDEAVIAAFEAGEQLDLMDSFLATDKFGREWRVEQGVMLARLETEE